MKKWLELSKADRKGVRDELFRPMYDRQVKLGKRAAVDLNMWVGHENGAFVNPKLFKRMYDCLGTVAVDARVAVICSPEMMIYLKELGHTDVTLVSYQEVLFLRTLADTAFGYQYTHWEELKSTMKQFDVIIGNPPYQGNAQLHQRFFNICVEQFLVDGGHIVFIQPATPYFNKKDARTHERKMQEHIASFQVSTKFVSSDVFENAYVGTELAITVLCKLSGNSQIRMVEYTDGSTFSNVDLSDVNMLKMPPSVYRQIREKYLKFITNNGSLYDITSLKKTSVGAYIQGIRGHINTEDFFSIVGNNVDFRRSFDGSNEGQAVDIDVEQYDFFYGFVQTFVARFGLALTKYNQQNARGELRTVPLVTFDRHWTDEALAELIGLTSEELEIIRNTLPDYHGLLNKKED